MSDPDPALISTYLAVARTGSLSAAARSLGVSQPTVRARIGALEGALGAALFQRGPQGLSPTGPAAALRAQAEAMEAEARTFWRTARSGADSVEGPVRVTSSRVHGTEVLPGILAPLLAAHPALELQIVAEDRTGDLLRRDADIAVRFVPPRQAALVTRRLRPIPLGFFAAPSYLDGAGSPGTVEDLADGHVFIGDDASPRMDDAAEAWGIPIPRGRRVRADDDLVQAAMIRAGAGIGVLQDQLGRRWGLTEILPGLLPPLQPFAVMHEDLRGLARMRAVWDRIVETMG